MKDWFQTFKDEQVNAGLFASTVKVGQLIESIRFRFRSGKEMKVGFFHTSGRGVGAFFQLEGQQLLPLPGNRVEKGEDWKAIAEKTVFAILHPPE